MNPSTSKLVGKIPPRGVASGSYRERLLVAVVVLFNSFTFFLIEYDRMRTWGSGLESSILSMIAGREPAPNQYRIGLCLVAHFLKIHAHIRANQSLPLIEFLSYAFALMLLYFIFRCSPQVQNASYPHRFVLLGFFLAAVQFPIMWIIPWDRPETLPTAFYLAAVVLLIVRRSRIPFVIVCLFIALLSLAQALVRAEVPVALGAAVLLSAAMAISFPRPRSHIAILGLLCVAIGGATQFYLQRSAYPSATYAQDTPKVQLLANLNLLHPPMHIPTFLTALLPLIVSLVLLRRHHLPLDPSDKLVLLILLVYLPLWVTMGLVVEVRIFVPFLFLASPTIAKLWGAFLLHQDHGAQPNPTASLR